MAHITAPDEVQQPLAEDIAPLIVRWMARLYKAKVMIRIERGENYFNYEMDARDKNENIK